MELYRKIEHFLLGILNWVWKCFILIHEYKFIFSKRRLYKNVILSSEQKRQIDNFYVENYGKKIPYSPASITVIAALSQFSKN